MRRTFGRMAIESETITFSCSMLASFVICDKRTDGTEVCAVRLFFLFYLLSTVVTFAHQFLPRHTSAIVGGGNDPLLVIGKVAQPLHAAPGGILHHLCILTKRTTITQTFADSENRTGTLFA